MNAAVCTSLAWPGRNSCYDGPEKAIQNKPCIFQQKVLTLKSELLIVKSSSFPVGSFRLSLDEGLCLCCFCFTLFTCPTKSFPDKERLSSFSLDTFRLSCLNRSTLWKSLICYLAFLGEQWYLARMSFIFFLWDEELKTLSVLVNIGILSPKFCALCVLNSLSPSVTRLLLREKVYMFTNQIFLKDFHLKIEISETCAVPLFLGQLREKVSEG